MARLFIDVDSGLPVNAEIYNTVNDLEAPGLIFTIPDDLWEDYQAAYTKFHTAESAILVHAGLKVPHKSW
jgi:hypothetical protein